MAHQNKIAKWVIQNKLRLQPVFTSFDWPARYRLNGCFDVRLRINCAGINAEGRGIALDSELAIEKASAEAIERWLCTHLGLSTVGVAVAGSESAEIHAANEILERFYLSDHIRLGQPFLWIGSSTLTESSALSALVKELLDSNRAARVDFFRMNTGPRRAGVVCRISESGLPETALGFALSNSLEKSMQHAFLEALPNWFAIKDLPAREQSIGKNKLGFDSNHLPWHLSESFLDKIQPLLTDTDCRQPFAPIAEPNVQIERINISANGIGQSLLHDCPINPVRAILPKEAL